MAGAAVNAGLPHAKQAAGQQPPTARLPNGPAIASPLCPLPLCRHPLNAEPPLSQLLEAGFHTPTALHYVR